MDLQELLRGNEIRKVEKDAALCGKLLEIAQESIAAAEDIAKIGRLKVAYSEAYNAMLNTGRALMLLDGYQAHSETHHKTVARYCAVSLGAGAGGLVNAFNKYRVKRHDLVYGDAGDVTEGEVKTVIERAKEMLKLVKEKTKA